MASQHGSSDALPSLHAPSLPSGVRDGGLLKEMLLSRRLRGGTIWKGAVARVIPRLGFTHAIVVMPAKSLALIIFVLGLANVHSDAHRGSRLGPSWLCSTTA